jgi:transglutaminase/protease-like cytokinesis protein 3
LNKHITINSYLIFFNKKCFAIQNIISTFAVQIQKKNNIMEFIIKQPNGDYIKTDSYMDYVAMGGWSLSSWEAIKTMLLTLAIGAGVMLPFFLLCELLR